MTWKEHARGLEALHDALDEAARERQGLKVRKGRVVMHTPGEVFLESLSLTFQAEAGGPVVAGDIDVSEVIFKAWPDISPRDTAQPALIGRVPIDFGPEHVVAGRPCGDISGMADVVLAYIDGLNDLVARLRDRR